MAEAKRDQNAVTTIIGVSSADGVTPVVVWVDPVTHRLLVDMAGASGDVSGPASSTNNNVVFFDGATGKLIKDSGLTLSGNNTGDQDLAPYALLTGATFTGAISATNLSGINTGDQNLSAYATLTGAETLTNKTLTAPVVNSPTGIVKADVGLSLVDNTSDATKNSATATLTNKRIDPRITTITSSATPTINTDNADMVTITALAVAITSMTTNLSGTPVNGQKLMIRFKDNGTTRAITWGTSFQDGSKALPTTTTASKVLLVGLIYDSVDSKWTCEASGERA